MGMNGSRERGYVARHEQILNKLVEMLKESNSGCIAVTKIADELGMDQRTVKAHLKVIEVHHVGVFSDPEEKQFCTKEGVTLLAKRLGVIETTDER
ncbi:hypothetical protein ACFLUU_05705 [Chloroflexota bacterium]